MNIELNLKRTYIINFYYYLYDYQKTWLWNEKSQNEKLCPSQ